MKLVFCAVIFILVVSTSDAGRRKRIRYAPRQKFNLGCPNYCECSRTDCRFEDDGYIDCLTTTVICRGGNFDQVTASMPWNVTSNMIVGDLTTRLLNLTMLKPYRDLNHLNIRGNNFEELSLAKTMKKLQTLRITENHLSRLPRTDMLRLRKLEILDLSNNKIQSIREIRFPVGLTQLILDDNLIDSLDYTAFQQLRDLIKLSITNNQIRRISRMPFRHLELVDILDLSNNSLTELKGGNLFKDMKMLWYLDLRFNDIDLVTSGPFIGMGTQSDLPIKIRLEHNAIKYLNENDIESLLPYRQTLTFYIAGNPIYCDCDMMRFRNKAKDFLGDTDRATCASPAESNGVALVDLYIDLCCDDTDQYYSLYENEALELYDYDQR